MGWTCTKKQSEGLEALHAALTDSGYFAELVNHENRDFGAMELPVEIMKMLPGDKCELVGVVKILPNGEMIGPREIRAYLVAA